MATNIYINADLTNANKGSATKSGAGVVALAGTYAKTAADNDTSVIRFFKGVPSTYIPLIVTVACEALSGATDVDMGVYKTDLGVVVDKDCLMDGQTLASASLVLNGLGGLAAADRGKPLYLLAGETVASHQEQYDIALTGNTFGTATGNIGITAIFAQQ